MKRVCERRTFLKTSLAASAGLGLTAMDRIIAKTTAWATQPSTQSMPQRPLGRTGRQVGLYGLGGLFTLARHDRHEEAVEIVNRAIDLGLNDIDTSAFYGDGASELNIGTVMKKRREEVFLASKSHNYTYDGTMPLNSILLPKITRTGRNGIPFHDLNSPKPGRPQRDRSCARARRQPASARSAARGV